jgi:hypothetical protein
VKDTLGLGHLQPEFELVPVGFGGRRVSTHGDPASTVCGHAADYRLF